MTQLTRDSRIRTLHVRFDGRSEEMPCAALDLAPHATDAEIKRSLEGRFDRPSGYFGRHVVVRHGDAIVVRPEAVYG